MMFFGVKGEKVLLKIEGMTCGHCVMRVEKTLNDLDGVKRARVSLKKNQAELIYDDTKTTVEFMKNAVIEAGYSIVE